MPVRGQNLTMKPAVACVLLGAALAGAQTPRSAASILDEAKTRAVADQRAIFLVFGASW